MENYDNWKQQSKDEPENECYYCGEHCEKNYCDNNCKKAYEQEN